MSDNKKSQDGRDRGKVDAKDRSEVDYVRKQFPDLSHQAVSGAIKAAGPLRKDVMDYLKNKGSKTK